MAKKDDKQGDGKKDKKGKKGAKGGDSDYTSIATHPKARNSVRKTKAWVGLLAFVVTALLSFKASVPAFQAFERALIAGVAGYLLAWWATMVVWRHLMLAEQKAAVEEVARRRAERAEAEAAQQG
jgi:hypothetical protein